MTSLDEIGHILERKLTSGEFLFLIEKSREESVEWAKRKVKYTKQGEI